MPRNQIQVTKRDNGKTMWFSTADWEAHTNGYAAQGKDILDYYQVVKAPKKEVEAPIRKAAEPKEE